MLICWLSCLSFSTPNLNSMTLISYILRYSTKISLPDCITTMFTLAYQISIKSDHWKCVKMNSQDFDPAKTSTYRQVKKTLVKKSGTEFWFWRLYLTWLNCNDALELFRLVRVSSDCDCDVYTSLKHIHNGAHSALADKNNGR